MDALIFDLDGVLTDTAEYHYLAWKRLADEHGLAFDRTVNEDLKGISRMGSLNVILKHNRAEERFSPALRTAMCARKNEYYTALIAGLGPENLLPGIRPLLKQAREAGLRLAVASVSRNAPSVLASLGIREAFQYVADAARVRHPKPAPDIFLDCARHLNAAPARCIGFEDAQAGVEAILAAGMMAVGINVKPGGPAPHLRYPDTASLSLPTILAAAERFLSESPGQGGCGEAERFPPPRPVQRGT